MQKRVLSFLMVLALVISMLPMTLVSAETAAAAEPGYTVTIQKAHNQTENFLAVDVYLQANTADQGDVTGYQFTVTPAEGLNITSVVDFTGNDGIAGSGTEFVYSPTLADPIAVGTSRVLVATVTLTGETLPAAAAEALTLSAVTISVADGFYSDDAADAATEGYKGAVATAAVADGCTHECAHGTGTWIALDQATLDASATTVNKENVYLLGAGNYYLTGDITAARKVLVNAAGAKINLCLNGYTYTSPAKDKMIEVSGKGAELNICDCTATGEGENLVAGKFILRDYNWGNFRMSGVESKLDCQNVILEGVETPNRSGDAATFYQPAAADNSSIYVENVLIRDIHARTLVDTRATGYYKNVTFVNCSGGQNSDTDDLGIFTTNGDYSEGTSLTIDGCKFIDCDDEILDTNEKKNITFTLKGDVQAEGAVYVNGSCKVNLELGKNADVTILTEKDKTEETFGDYVVIPEGATLPSGTLLYKNADLMVEYADGKFSFVGHAHKATTYANGTEEGHAVEDLSFKAWDDSNALPTSGNYYLTTDVTINRDRYDIGRGKTLNLDLNGHTVTQAKPVVEGDSDSHTGVYMVYGTLNLFDCQSGYDAEGNWVGGQITGGSGTLGGAITVDRSQVGKTNNGVFNMYGGRICGNSTTSSGGAVYLYSSLAKTDGNQSGGVFNMYGGELYNNHSDTWGGAITANGISATASGSKGADPALELGAKINIHGGKIHGNTAYKRDTTSTGWSDATIYVAQDAIFTMTGGEISNNSAHRGGAIFMNAKATRATITGGKITGNSAVESAQMVAKKDVALSGKGGAIHCGAGTLYIENAEISGNTATQAGALYIVGGASTNVDIINTKIDDNSAYDSRTTKFHDTATNDANRYWGNGGAMYITGAATDVYVKDCQITNNTAAKKTNWNDYQGCAGAVYVANSTKTVFEGCTFSGNDTAQESGGALNVNNNADVLVKDCVFTENTAGTTGAAAYALGASTVLRLEDTTIYGNTIRSNLGGAGIYITSSTTRLVASGKVVVDQNTNTLGTVGRNNIFFQNNDSRTRLLEVDELAAGSHMTIFFDAADTSTSTIIANKDDASKYVEITAGGTQSDWECGWVTAMRKADTVGRQVAYLDLTDDGVDNKTFEFGHYHKGPDGTYHLLNPWTGTASLPDANDTTTGNGYYLTSDVVVSSSTNSAEYRDHTTHSATGYDYELCLNGHKVSLKSGIGSRAITLRSANGWVGDCTASFDENGFLISGGVVDGFHNTENGGIFYITDDKSIGTNITLYGIEIKNGYETKKRDKNDSPGYSGAGIHIRHKNSALNIIGCKFTGNHTPMEGGAICSREGANVTATDTIFKDNYSGRLGGAIYMLGSATSNNADLELNNCRFLNNYTTSNPTKWTDDTATEVNETITPFKDTGLGGAVYAKYSNVTVKDCYFEDNQAINAEALTNTNHTEAGMGGAIYMAEQTSLDIDGCEFNNNYAKYQGGAIYILGSNAAYEAHTIDDTIFDGNTANGYGGALITLNSSSKLNITGTKEKPVIFRNNKTLGQEYVKSTDADGKPVMATQWGYGGGYDIMNGKITIIGAEFYNNEARFGGALRTAGGGGTTNALIDGCIIDGNKAMDRAGAIDLNGDTATVQNCTITNNTAGNYGGAFRVQPAGKVDEAAGNTQTIKDSVISGNEAKYGGAFAVFGNSVQAPELVISGTTIENNTAATSGGVFYGHSNTSAQFRPVVTLTDTTISGNYGKTGGVVYGGSTDGYQGMDMTFDSCEITGNSAVSVSAIQLTNVNNITLKDTAVTGNWTTSTTGDYAAINTNNSTGKLYVDGNTTIYDNFAGKDSGVQRNVYMRDFANNMASVNIDTANGAALAATAKIGISLEGTSKRTQYAVTNDGTKAFAGNFVSDKEQYSIVTIDAANKVYISQAGVGASIYISAQKAIDAINAAVATDPNADKTLVLFADVKADLTSASDLFIDLDGKSIQKLTMAEGTKVTLIDSETNDYDVADGVYGKVVIDGDFDAYYEDNTSGLKRYVVVTDEDGVSSAHRVYLGINKKVLRTANAGIGFKAIFAGDQVVEEYITGYGIKVWKTEDPDGAKYADFMHYEFENGTGNGAPNQVTAVIKNVLQKDNAENQARFETAFTGAPVITIGEGDAAIVIEGKQVTTSMNAIAKGNASNEAVLQLLSEYTVTIQ